ncbi:hypothetical protein GGX14DRAFT_578125 [Mycena pura]|uniref:Uncharacterized protein n=1 Tax=Mycena pura TaxID=153505 RepID=A0AAD6UQF4_9AGAR|nr:hypothetical protein GGX14DRAFT_578125 [Mycena pura]
MQAAVIKPSSHLQQRHCPSHSLPLCTFAAHASTGSLAAAGTPPPPTLPSQSQSATPRCANTAERRVNTDTQQVHPLARGAAAPARDAVAPEQGRSQSRACGAPPPYPRGTDNVHALQITNTAVDKNFGQIDRAFRHSSLLTA